MKETYVIGEIGQNHNGSVKIAKSLVELITKPIKEDFWGIDIKPMNAVKMTKRDLSEELSETMMNKPYINSNSFGCTYGSHRQFLELSNEEHYEIYSFAKALGLDFIETLCSKRCLSILKLFSPDKLKIASRDLTNLPLLEALSETKIPIILSTGMAGKKELDDAINIVNKYHSDISILHCVSQYPTHPANLNLKTITYLKSNYGQYVIGFSDHTIGISASVVAVGIGAEIIEKHITLDRNMKGTDHLCSLGPEGINRMMRDIRFIDQSLGEESLTIQECTMESKVKLERSVASNRRLERGHIISKKDLHLLSPGDGFSWSQLSQVLDKTVVDDINSNEIIYPKHIK